MNTITRWAVAVSAATAAAAATLATAPEAAAAPPRISVDDRTVHVGQTVEFTATGLNPNAGYYVMLCQNQPAFYPVCARPGNIANSFVHLSNRDSQATPIAANGRATGTLRIALHDTSLFGPLPNGTRINCAAFGGCSVAVVEDHQHSRSPGGMFPSRVATVGVTVR